MALYAIAGDGTGNKTEILKSLSDLRDKAEKESADFWFVFAAKEELTKTDEAVLEWLRSGNTWFEVIGEESEAYAGAQKYHSAKSANTKILGMMKEAQDNGEDVSVLALFVSPDDEDPADGELMTLVEKAMDEDYPVLLLNGQLVRLTFEEGGDDAAAEDDETPAEEDDTPVVFTREELTAMKTPELTALAKGQGIDVKGLGKRDLITALLGETVEEPEAPTPSKAAGASKKAAPAKAAASKKAAAAAVEEDDDVTADEVAEVEEIMTTTNGDNMALVVVHYQGRFLTAQIPAAQAMAMVTQ